MELIKYVVNFGLTMPRTNDVHYQNEKRNDRYLKQNIANRMIKAVIHADLFFILEVTNDQTGHLSVKN